MKNIDRYKKIGAKIKEAREALSMSQVDLATSVGFSSPTAIALIESGDRKVSIDTLEHIAVSLQKNVHFFLEGDTSTPDVGVALRSAAGLSAKDKDLLLRVYELVKDNDDDRNGPNK
jgi:transcriptional regulator with XRE-family HTH domain